MAGRTSVTLIIVLVVIAGAVIVLNVTPPSSNVVGKTLWSGPARRSACDLYFNPLWLRY